MEADSWSRGDRSHKKQLRFLFPSIATNHSEPLMLVRGTGLHLYDAEGRECLDCPGGNPVSACAAKAATEMMSIVATI